MRRPNRLPNYGVRRIRDAEVEGYLRFPDDVQLRFGDSDDVAIEWDTGQTQDALLWSVSGSNTVIFMRKADMGVNLAFTTQTNPTLFIFSASVTGANKWVSFTHNQTDGVFTVGSGGFVFTSPATTNNIIDISSTVLTSGYGLLVNVNNSGFAANGLVRFVQDHASATGHLLYMVNDGTGMGCFIDQNGNRQAIYIDSDASANPSIQIDQDNNSASTVYGIVLAVDNAGIGSAGGIDMSSFSAGEPLFKVPSTSISALGVLSGQFGIDVGGTIYYIPYYTSGT